MAGTPYRYWLTASHRLTASGRRLSAHRALFTGIPSGYYMTPADQRRINGRPLHSRLPLAAYLTARRARIRCSLPDMDAYWRIMVHDLLPHQDGAVCSADAILRAVEVAAWHVLHDGDVLHDPDNCPVPPGELAEWIVWVQRHLGEIKAYYDRWLS